MKPPHVVMVDAGLFRDTMVDGVMCVCVTADVQHIYPLPSCSPSVITICGLLIASFFS